MFSLFNNRISATYGWNLMAGHRRQYWGLGFGFIRIAQDLGNFIRRDN